MPAPARPSPADAPDESDELTTSIFLRLRAHLYELRIERIGAGVVLRGRASSYYGKQMAQQEAFLRGLVVIANDIVVL
jgi:hypothetical protein